MYVEYARFRFDACVRMCGPLHYADVPPPDHGTARANNISYVCMYACVRVETEIILNKNITARDQASTRMPTMSSQRTRKRTPAIASERYI